MGLKVNPYCPNFHPDVRYVQCRYCKEPVDLAGPWNEQPTKPAHRLCENSQIPPPFTVPLRITDLKMINTVLVNGWNMPLLWWEKTIRLIRQTMDMHDPKTPEYEPDRDIHAKRQVMAAALLARIVAVQSGTKIAARKGLSGEQIRKKHRRTQWAFGAENKQPGDGTV